MAMYDGMVKKGYLAERDDTVILTLDGEEFASQFGIDLTILSKSRRPMCKSCLDWSSRRTHLAGSLGTAFLNEFYKLNWASRGERVTRCQIHLTRRTPTARQVCCHCLSRRPCPLCR